MDGISSKETPRKSSVRLSAREDLLRQARDGELDLSQLLEEAIEAAIERQRTDRRREDNREALELYGEYIRRYGLWNSRSRDF
jgi:post-segregation antitoxin (ccd killing protein)